jgi:hypothetical protein
MAWRLGLIIIVFSVLIASLVTGALINASEEKVRSAKQKQTEEIDKHIHAIDEILSTRNNGYPTWEHPVSDQERADIASWLRLQREEMVRTGH